MIPFRFIQCGDLHLGAPFKSMPTLSSSMDEVLRRATYRSFENIVKLAVTNRVDALFITGDIYNTDDHNIEAQVFFSRCCHQLDQADIPVYLIHGNHDLLQENTNRIALPKNVRVFDGSGKERYPLVVHGQEVAAVYGMSLSPETVRMDCVKRLTPQQTDTYSIALWHGTVGAQPAHEVVAPCSLEALKNAGFDYWALGHIHKRQVLNEMPYVVYAGNSQGLHRKEVGAKGCYLVQVSSNGHCELRFKETEAVRFESVTIDISGLSATSDIEEMLRHEQEVLRRYKKPCLMDIIFTGRGSLHSLCADETVRKSWLDMLIEGEQGLPNFIVPIRMDDQSRPDIDLVERRRLHDMAGDYLIAYDKTAKQEPADCLASLREILENRPEAKRLGAYKSFLTDDLLEKALSRAELEGALKLVGDMDED